LRFGPLTNAAPICGKLGNTITIVRWITCSSASRHYGRAFTAAVTTASNYEEIGAWLQTNGTPKTAVEIKAWSDRVEAGSMNKDPERRAYFIENCKKVGINPETSTTFDWLEADDRASF